MNISYFLGANTERGFFSLYDGFCRAEGDMLHIIKGGPGTGKSGFMRRIAQKAQELGYDTQCVLCSGDPDSLDGVYVPALHTGWVDGTAPHAAEPEIFGVTADYVNLGQFCRLPLSEEAAAQARQLSCEYRQSYKSAYGFLTAAGAVHKCYMPQLLGEKQLAAPKARLRTVIERAAKQSPGRGIAEKRFISALSCKGRLYMPEQLRHYAQVFTVDNRYLEAAPLISHAAELAHEAGLDTVECLSPLIPEELEALLLPNASTAFIRAGMPYAGRTRHIHADTLVPPERRRSERNAISAGKDAEEMLTQLALLRLTEAKTLHDLLEQVYRPYMDFAALTDYTNAYIAKLFT